MAADTSTNIDLLNSTLQAIIGDGASERQLPPVHLWNPDNCGDIGMEIRKDGSWWHEGTRITRQKLVDLFARILRKDEDGSTYLVTPYEKVIVHVEDAHFLAIRLDVIGAGQDSQKLVFTTNLGDMAVVDTEHPLRVETDPETLEPAPYVRIRGRLEGKLTRAAFYDLVNYAEENDGRMIVKSSGLTIDIGPAEMPA